MTVVVWGDFPGPRHEDEVEGSHDPNSPPLAVQNATHGAPAPAPDHGVPDDVKYA